MCIPWMFEYEPMIQWSKKRRNDDRDDNEQNDVPRL